MERAPLHDELARVPEQGSAYWVRANDGVRLRVGFWKGPDNGKGSVFLLPGRTQYIELQGQTVESLHRYGYATLVIDWRGHGLSDRIAEDRNTIHIERFSDYQRDVAALVRAADELELPKPWYLIGASLGGCIGLRAIAEGMPVTACAFTGPMWGIKLKPIERIAAWTVSWGAQAFGRGEAYCPGHDCRNYALNNPFKGNRITNDAETYQLWRNHAQTRPELQTGGSSMGWLLQGLLECRRLSKIRVPDTLCIAFCGDQDGVVDFHAIEKRMAGWRNGRVELIRNAKHELLLEVPAVRERVMTQISDLFRQSAV